jgi:hypothetical protein
MELEMRYQQRLEEWLKISNDQWEQLLGFGVEDGTELDLDYSFSTEAEESARAFATAFQQRYGTQPEVRFLEADDIGPAIWAIHGTTPPTPSSLAFLNSWVEDLVRLGAMHNCLFEGWGTYPPQAKPSTSLKIGSFSADQETIDKYPVLINFFIPLPLQPIERSEQFDQPLERMLVAEGLGRIVRSGSICDIGDEGLAIIGFEIRIRVIEYDTTSKRIREFLIKTGAPENHEMEQATSDLLVD